MHTLFVNISFALTQPLFPVSFRFFRSASTVLIHVLVWGLVVVLLWAQQPDYPGPKPNEFWLT
ncbi:MAG: hypothetical protein EOO62_27590, partial [Hymenobacter sp.]